MAHDAPRNRRAVSPALAGSLGRVTQACRACATNHLRCTEEKPCHRCIDKGLDCLWDRSSDSGTTPPAATADLVDGPGFAPSGTGATSEQRPPTVSTDIDQLPEGSTPQPLQAQPFLGTLSAPPGVNHDPSAGEPKSTLQVPLHGDLTAHQFTGLPNSDLLLGQWMPMGSLDFDANFGFELNDIDLRFLEAYNTNLPFEFDRRLQNTQSTKEPPYASSDPCRPAILGTEAYRNYYWKFRPNVQDHGAAEEHNLSLPATAHDHGSPESRISLERRITCAVLSLSSRDKILTSIMQTCRTEDLSRVVQAFPGAELLDTLLQYYLTSPVARSDNFLHGATFDPNKKRPDLLAAMVAAGAVLTSDPTLSKHGLAIQECLRVAIPRHWERNNTLTRDLELWQAYLIVLEIGLWSGHSRKVEIAESFLQPLVTMVRRDGKLKRSDCPKSVIPGDCDDSVSLHSAWTTWVETESFKRLAFRMLEHDTNASFSLLVNPLISYADIQLPIPDPAEMWSALSPTQWKASFLSEPNSSLARPLTLADYMDDTENFHAYKNTVDTSIVSSAFLSCAWRLTWEYTQLRSLQRAGSGKRSWNALLMSGRHEEILKLLSNFRISADLDVTRAEEITMRVELILMHLHMPFNEIQLFAGMDGLEQARYAYPTINQWVTGDSARTAVWHGGQVLRAAKLLPRGALWGPSAMMVYHASLVLWVYGLLFEMPGMTGSASSGVSLPSSAGGQSQNVYLDGPDDIATQRFLQFGRGLPFIRSLPGLDNQLDDVQLSRPDRVMETVVDILRRNHDEMFRPHSVDNLIQLIGGLQKAAGPRALS
ncbi:uncharacterized protein HMPREF1541_02101 [Cyphellophora europaea CBS 101466]|uniref:Zn(2)-C6 fungal-type domain-containing protein n=1 Tax=Cyphellophora europaea (strain CBS 101466) TaxID=1220924 RepID=W2S4H6_CYPE1|nr:uncharacterized protein HMPREF1541_02101 [Cyphellophora europaea CBS 101466]ETN42943.1 hypothetical protein HMPREF1541_02101 [Cyphellophora europaea CBS 101466]